MAERRNDEDSPEQDDGSRDQRDESPERDDEPSGHGGDSSEQGGGSSGTGDDAPKRGMSASGADIESLEKMEASEEAKAATPSDVDARGVDKHRQVVGGTYGPTRKSQFIFFAIVAAVVVVLVGGYALAIAAFDQPKDEYPDAAPWSQTDAQQKPTSSPSSPCGEPGNPYPVPEDSPCLNEGTQGKLSHGDVSDAKSVEPSNATGAQ